MRGLIIFGLVAGVAAAAGPVRAQEGGGGATTPTKRSTSLPSSSSSYSGLLSHDADEIRAGIRQVQRDRSFRAVRALAERIDNGLPPRLLDDAIDALIAIGRGPSSRVLLSLTRHRRATVRAKVASGLVATRAPNARRELVRLLDDPSTTVRSAAATAIGELGARLAMRELLEATMRGVPEAALIVTAQATPYQVTQIARRLNEESLDALSPVLRGFAGRQDLSERARRIVLTRLDAVGTPGCFRVLSQIVSDLEEDDPIRATALELVEAQTESEVEEGETSTTVVTEGGES